MLVISQSKEVWDLFRKDNEVLIYRYIVRKIKKGIAQKDPITRLFGFKNSDQCIYVEEPDYFDVLNHALSLFISEEEYELASKLKEFITTYHIDKVIGESNNYEE